MDDVTKAPQYTKRFFSGTCLCGHDQEDHHTAFGLNPDYVVATGELTIAEECEVFGSNEGGGLDLDGRPHCGRYVDRDDPDDERRADWEALR